MADEISSDSKQKYIFIQFSDRIEAGTLVTITDKNDTPIMAYLTEKPYQVLLFSSPDLDNTSYNVYTSGDIQGKSENGLYTEITSYTKGIEANYTEASGNRMMGQRPDFDKNNKFENNSNDDTQDMLIIIAILVTLLIIVIVIKIIVTKNEKNSGTNK